MTSAAGDMRIVDRIEDLDFAELVRPGDSVVCSQALAEPVSLMRRLMEQRARIGRFGLYIGPSFSGVFRPEHADLVSFQSYCATGRNIQLADAGALDIVPTHYADISRMFAQGWRRCDVALLTLGEPDAEGRFNLGVCHDHMVEAARRARLVIAEVCPRVPWVHGAELPPDIRPHILVRTGRELLTLEASGSGGPQEEAIGRLVAGLVPDGATLEMGIGGMLDPVVRALSGHRDLGIHTGVIGDALVDLMQAGVITNARKPFDRGISVAGILMGSRRVLEHAHRNPAIRLAPSSHTHGLAAMQAIPDYYTINAALEVDLTGQVNAEVVNGRYIGAVGGQVDFVRGANASSGGRSILVLQAVDRKGTASRIVPRLADGLVTTPRSDVDIVVTEFGVAQLRSRSIQERRQALIAIAHPDFREGLARHQP